MSRIPAVTSEKATPKALELLEKTQAQLGRIPNLYRVMANSPAALHAYLSFREALTQGVLSPQVREQIALLTAEKNQCEYCVSAHMFRGQKIGIPLNELRATRMSSSCEPKIAALLQFASQVIDKKGLVDDQDYLLVINTGWTHEEIGEMIAHIALNIFSNYYNHLGQPDLDFPPVPVGIYD